MTAIAPEATDKLATSPVEDQVNRFEGLIELLSARVERLARQLEPVLTPPYPMDDGGSPGDDPGCDLARRLDGLNGRLAAWVDEIDALRNRLGI